MRWKAWIGILVSAVFLYLSVRKVDLNEMKTALDQANYLLVLPSSILLISSFWVRAYRWQILLAPVKWIPTKILFAATMIGFMANNVLPARLGEFIRADAIGRLSSVNRSSAFATIVIERLFDGMILILFLASTLALPTFPDWIRQGGTAAMGLYLVLILFLYLLHIRTDTALRLIRFITRPLPDRVSEKTLILFESFASGLHVLSQGRRMLSTCALTLVLWLLNIASLQCIVEAFHLSLPAYAAFTIMAIIALGVTLPSSPGYVGVFQAACILALALFGIPRGMSLSFSIVLHVVGYIPITAIGLVYFWKAHLSFKDFKAVSKES